MLIVSELGEALEAHRSNHFCDMKELETAMNCLSVKAIPEFVTHFKNIKDSFEMEIADVFIRLFDLCGYLNINVPDNFGMNSGMLKEYMSRENVGESFLVIATEVCEKRIWIPIEMLLWFCDHNNIPIEKHLSAKMAYNRTRPRKHGKRY